VGYEEPSREVDFHWSQMVDIERYGQPNGLPPGLGKKFEVPHRMPELA